MRSERTACPRGGIGSQLTRDVLTDEYVKGGRSLEEIGQKFGCTRQYVAKRMRAFGILRRSASGARQLAAEKGLRPGSRVNQNFFRTWSPEMAYVLGVIFTDGCIHDAKVKDTFGRVTKTVRVLSLAQKEPELLNKVLSLMQCDAKLTFSPKRTYKTGTAGERYSFSLTDHRICEDLVSLGVTPRKSRVMEFPRVPRELDRHFIRGCWDGDGSVYRERGRRQLVASYVSGSRAFIERMIETLGSHGLRRPTLYTLARRTSRGEVSKSYYFKFHGADVGDLREFLYEGVSEDRCLTRKRNRFMGVHRG